MTERRLRKHSHDSGDRRLLALTEHSRDIITVASAEGVIQFVIGGVRNSLGYTSEEREANNLAFEHVHSGRLGVAPCQVPAIGGW